MKRILLVSCVFILSLVTALYAGEKKLTREDVAEFVKQGMPEDKIISVITESDSEFALTDQDRRWLDERYVSPWVCIVMDMKPRERREKVPFYTGGKITKEGVIQLTKKGYPAHEIVLMIARTQSRYTLTEEEKQWLRNEGVDPLVINLMEIQREVKKQEPFLEQGAIERGGLPIRGGKYYTDAVEIKPGKYRLDHQLRPDEYDYFKIKLKNGQRLICSVRTTDVASKGGIAIHSYERTAITKAEVYHYNGADRCFFALYDSAEKEKEVYILIGCGNNSVDTEVIYAVSVEDNFDANSATDAGKHFDTALAIKPGEYPHNWATGDDVDMYTLRLKKKGEISVKLTPYVSEGSFTVSILNEDRENMVVEWSKQAGAVVKTSAINPDAEQKVYIKVERGTSDPVGKYALKIEVK